MGWNFNLNHHLEEITKLWIFGKDVYMGVSKLIESTVSQGSEPPRVLKIYIYGCFQK